MLVRELIGRPLVACSPQSDVVAAARTMLVEEVGALAVVDGTKLVGIMTDRDLVRAMTERRKGPIRVEAIMTADPDCVMPDLSIDDAAEWMTAMGYRHLPVVEQGQVIGMVSIKDLLWAMTGPAGGTTGVQT